MLISNQQSAENFPSKNYPTKMCQITFETFTSDICDSHARTIYKLCSSCPLHWPGIECLSKESRYRYMIRFSKHKADKDVSRPSHFGSVGSCENFEFEEITSWRCLGLKGSPCNLGRTNTRYLWLSELEDLGGDVSCANELRGQKVRG